MTGRISFIGAGPGAADLITVRGARRIAEADIVVWAASLVAPECVREHARADAELVDSSQLTHEQALEIYRRAERDRLAVARVHSGDPSLWSAVQEQYDVCVRMALQVEIVPGVAAFSAAAASVGRELTVPEVAQSLVLTRLEGGKTPMPDGEKVREFAKHGTTMVLFLSAARTGQMVEELQAGGYTDDTPVVVAYKVTWPDELILRTTLGELTRTVKEHKLWRHTLFLVGNGLTTGGVRSRLYHAGRSHALRRGDEQPSREPRAEWTGTRSPARGGSGSADSGAESGGTARVRDSDVAWWAVRDWQETARGAARVAVSKATERDAEEAQPDLFDPAEPEPALSESAPSESTQSESTQSESAQGEAAESEPAESEPAVPVQQPAGTSGKGRGAGSGSGKAPAKTGAKSSKSTGTGKQSAGRKSARSTAKPAADTSAAKTDDREQ
ncbi:precorrin-4 C(11)-methyltransferase [Saccharopolyspora sp. HNM0983]|uniref:Precorrin-4 C(11)-methyltransferase n=1 Tax=Saccharopolyspora montiporae TaxID=2781240 RepID=A0A929FZF9_9PSEU|nr:precorrin-4 C(11)-methyltransferase [Saccharopolyspora sp. HNM0983]